MKVECIDYRQLPNLNPLLPQYLYQYDQVDTLYDCPVHLSLEDLKRASRFGSKKSADFSP